VPPIPELGTTMCDGSPRDGRLAMNEGTTPCHMPDLRFDHDACR